jgi:tripartite-type tricarboxylate transporter receptor subunit TctC
VSEAGLPGYDSTGWFGVVAPAATPTPIVDRLNAEINAALNDETIKASIRQLGVEPSPGTRESFEAYMRSETQKWAKVIKAANVKIN